MNNIIKTILVGSVAILAASCDGDRYDLQTMATEKYHKVLSFKDAQYDDLVLYNVNEEKTVSFKVLKGGSNPDAPCSAKISAMTQEELLAYGSAYVMIPSDCYSVTEAIEYLQGEPSKDITLTFTGEGIKKLNDLQEQIKATNGQLCLGLKLESDDATIHEQKAVALRKISVSSPVFGVSVAGFDNNINNLLGIRNLDRGDLYNLPTITFYMKEIDNNWSSSFSMKYRKDLVAEYNRLNGTHYEALEDGVLALETETPSINPGENELSVKMIAKAKYADPTRQYLVPIEISNDRFAVEFKGVKENKNIFYMLLNSEIKLTEKNIWDPDHCDYDGQGKVALVDNNVARQNFWTTPWRRPSGNMTWHQFYQVDFDTPLTEALAFHYWKRDYNNVRPTEIEFWVTDKERATDNKADWVMLDSVNQKEDGLPDGWDRVIPWCSKGYKFSDYPNLSGKQIRHMRVVFVKSHQGVLGNGTTNSVAITEMKLWGK